MAVEFNEAFLGYGRTVVLSDVSLTVRPGHAVGILGSNGTGKSTVLKATVGLADVLGGEVKVDGAIGYVPQHAETASEFPITAGEVVALGLVHELKPFQRIGASGRQRSLDALAAVGLEARARVRFADLSGGQRQRVLVARAIVSAPPVLVLDEPFNGLDSENRRVLIEVLEEQKRKGVAVLLSTHDLALSDAVCDATLTVANGRISQ
ncbi:metal ABC transporter ATP-binding protein [Corynebacterium sp.]|uniref:metal ABC transporter ATP-binding protein n=1 Tax=Corynebacterium sp. TaxID=1720 RepID=UPI002A915B19|nr:ATP-binding cassette domain-containing protein [Corynebacterium sp.]MDY5786277.1 ATP-binding cassette domain-containing protein [Corynebacterium sp.]